MSGRYAVDTKVPVGQSRNEIEAVLKRYGADSFAYAQAPGQVTIGFRIEQRIVRFAVSMPDENKETRLTRSRWRALLLCIKAKLESVAAGIESFDEAFMPHVVTPNGQTVGQLQLPHLKAMYQSGKQPPLLSFEGGK